MGGITVTRRGDRLLATKTADDGEQGARLHHEAALLRRLHHPGVVELVALDEGPPPALHTGFVGTDTWATRPPTRAAAITHGLSAVAATIGDLHALGIAHRALTPDHVLVAPDGRPVLCGLADATDADDPAVFDDLRGLARLIETVAQHEPTVGAALVDLAHRADHGGLTAHDLAAALAAVAVDPAPAERRPRPRRTPALLLPAVVMAIVMSVGGWVMLQPSGATSDPPPTTTEPPPTTAPPDPAIVPADDALVLDHAGRRYAVADADHEATVGDWNCDGTATPAVLDPATGTVSFFLTWPGPGEAVEAHLTLVVAGGHTLLPDPDDRCGRLRVLHPTGSTLLTPEFP